MSVLRYLRFFGGGGSMKVGARAFAASPRVKRVAAADTEALSVGVSRLEESEERLEARLLDEAVGEGAGVEEAAGLADGAALLGRELAPLLPPLPPPL